MSDENIEVVRKTIEAWNAGDMDRLQQFYDPDAVLRLYADAPEGGLPVVGRDNIMRVFGQMREAWDGTDTGEVLSDFLTVGDRVLVRVAWRGAGQGPAMALEATLIYTVRSGLVFEIEFVRDHDAALEAVGLRE
ncbi:MAG: nuclear transport factor 2 family protein [Thermoleophilaceae bacterium]